MDQTDKTRQIFLAGTIILGALIVGGLVWAIAMGPGESNGTIDANIVFNDDTDPVQGPSDAKATVRIYSDFQCPACKAAEAPLRQVMKDYEGKVRFIWNDFPLMSLHANSKSAAIAGRCAQEQGKFWEFAAKLYDSQEQWSTLPAPNDFYINLADSLALDKEHFAACLSQDAPAAKVIGDYQESMAMGLDSTPSYFVNRQKYVGVIDVKTWHQMLDSQLK